MSCTFSTDFKALFIANCNVNQFVGQFKFTITIRVFHILVLDLTELDELDKFI